ncbi:MAG TPA: hypothetical protein VFJ28_10590 [Marmoricola sp.]|nr:hypothetical protein [Marmoricola sp.]
MPLRGILNQVLGGRRGAVGTRRPVGGTTGGVGGGTTTGMAGGGRRTQDEAIGRGVRTLLGRFRRP